MYGIIDIGSNTIRPAVYKIENNRPKPLFSKKFTAGLASYINKNGALSKKGIDKAVSTLKQFTPILENVSLNAVYVFATASLRNIRNSEYALKTISRHSGFDIQLISGETEGILGFSGANPQEFAKEILKTAPERIHALIPGLTVLYGICRRCGQPDIYVSPYGIRGGYLQMKIQEETVKHE